MRSISEAKVGVCAAYGGGDEHGGKGVTRAKCKENPLRGGRDVGRTPPRFRQIIRMGLEARGTPGGYNNICIYL